MVCLDSKVDEDDPIDSQDEDDLQDVTNQYL